LATKLSTRLAKVSGDENVSFSLTKFCWRGFEEKSLSLANRIEKVAGKVGKRRARAMGGNQSSCQGCPAALPLGSRVVVCAQSCVNVWMNRCGGLLPFDFYSIYIVYISFLQLSSSSQYPAVSMAGFFM